VTKTHAATFVAGFVCGVAALLIGLAVKTSGTPREAGAAPAVSVAPAPSPAPAAANVPSADQIAAAVVRALENRTTGAKDNRENALRSDVQTIRSQVELYKVQHGGRRPGVDAQGRFDSQLFARQLTQRTDVQGNTLAGKEDGSERFGPYLQRMPANPYMSGPAAAVVSGGKGPAPRDGASGYWVDTDTGLFGPNHQERSGS